MGLKIIYANKNTDNTPIAKLIKGDNNSSAIRIVIPRYADGVDLFGMGWSISVNNANGESDLHIPEITEDESIITLDYTPHGIATSAEGITRFQVQGVNNDGNAWNTGFIYAEIGNRIDASPGDYTEELTEIQQLIVFVHNELADVQAAAEAVREAYAHPPAISDNNTWMIWDPAQAAYVDTGSPTIGEGGGSLTVDSDGNATISGGFAVDENGNATI